MKETGLQTWIIGLRSRWIRRVSEREEEKVLRKILPIFLKGSNVFCLVSTVKVAGISVKTTSGFQ